MDNFHKLPSMGWLPDHPDFRDYSTSTTEVSDKHQRLQEMSVNEILSEIGIIRARKSRKKLKKSINLREYCSPIDNQGDLNSCTAHAGVGLVEYFEIKTSGKYINASKMFLYKATRNLAKSTTDSGAQLRTTMAAMVLFGIPPEKYWPYYESQVNKEPTAFCYAFAQNYQALQYYRLDTPGITPEELLTHIKINLAYQLPIMFGFSTYQSINEPKTKKTGMIPYPNQNESAIDGHAVVAVGYDDDLKIENNYYGQTEPTEGAFLIRNSWGRKWGDKGYGWLPYDYVLKGLARDWWSLLKSEWIDTKVFGV